MYDVFVAAHVALACTGVFVLFRGLGFGAAGAFLAALVPLTGPILSFENLLIGLQGMAYAPWTYWAGHRLLVRPSLLNIGLLGLFGGWHLQGIMPEIVLLDICVGLALLSAWSLRGRTRRWGETALAVFTGLSVAWMVAAIELMPVVEALFESRRGRGFTYEEQAVWSLHPYRAVDVLVPSFWTVPEVGLARFGWLYDARPRPYLLSIYLGLLVALAVSRNRRARIALGVAAFFVVVSLGAFTPVHGWISGWPLLRNGRFPVKFMVLAAAALSVALAYAPRGWLRYRHPHTPVLVHALVVVGLWWVLSGDGFMRQAPLSPPRRVLLGVGPQFLAEVTRDAQGLRLAHALVLATLAALATVVIKAPRWKVRVLLALAGFDLAWAGGYAIQGAPAAGPSPELAAALERGRARVFRLAPNDRNAPIVVDPAESLARQITIDQGRRGALSFERQRVFFDNDPDGQSNPASAQTLRLIHRSRYPEAEVLLGRVGVGRVSTWASVRRPGVVDFAIPGQRPQRVYPIEPHRSYVEVFSQWQAISPDALLAPAHRSHLQRLDTWETALVLAPAVPAPTVTSSAAARACRAGAEVTVDADRVGADRYGLDVRLACDGLLLIQETFVSDWMARVDGRVVPVYPAEMGQTAIWVPAGDHRVELVYPGRLRQWWGVSLFGLGAALMLVVAGISIRRRTGRRLAK